mmetsp:Transcript_106592/g.343940  ORF Transcript_106592/g.343940 Transcript_106592/m.343940 type:complete len:517 (+) Transcript_106592:1570-3120(+)
MSLEQVERFELHAPLPLSDYVLPDRVEGLLRYGELELALRIGQDFLSREHLARAVLEEDTLDLPRLLPRLGAVHSCFSGLLCLGDSALQRLRAQRGAPLQLPHALLGVPILHLPTFCLDEVGTGHGCGLRDGCALLDLHHGLLHVLNAQLRLLLQWSRGLQELLQAALCCIHQLLEILHDLDGRLLLLLLLPLVLQAPLQLLELVRALVPELLLHGARVVELLSEGVLEVALQLLQARAVLGQPDLLDGLPDLQGRLVLEPPLLLDLLPLPLHHLPLLLRLLGLALRLLLLLPPGLLHPLPLLLEALAVLLLDELLVLLDLLQLVLPVLPQHLVVHHQRVLARCILLNLSPALLQPFLALLRHALPLGPAVVELPLERLLEFPLQRIKRVWSRTPDLGDDASDGQGCLLLLLLRLALPLHVFLQLLLPLPLLLLPPPLQLGSPPRLLLQPALLLLLAPPPLVLLAPPLELLLAPPRLLALALLLTPTLWPRPLVLPPEAESTAAGAAVPGAVAELW